MNPEDRKHIEAIRHALNKALGQARVAVDDAPHWAKDVVWLLDLVERQEAARAALLLLLTEAARVLGERIAVWSGPEADEDAIGIYGALHELLGREEEAS